MPREYEFNGQVFDVADDVSEEQVLSLFSRQQPPQDERGYASRIADSAKASFYQTTQGLAALAMSGGADVADTIAEFERDMPPVSQEMSNFQRADGWKAALTEVFNDWETLPTLIAQGITGSYPAIAGGVAGAALVNPITAAAGVGLGSAAVEAGTTLLDVFRSEGVDLKNPEAVRAAFNNPELKAKAMNKGIARGIPVGAFDAASAGFAGRLLGPALKQGRGVARAAAGEAVVQGLAGGAGEVAGSVAAGDKISPSAVIAEVVSEIASGAPEVASLALRRNADALRQTGSPLTADAVEQTGVITGIPEAVARANQPQETPAEKPEVVASDLQQATIPDVDTAIQPTDQVSTERQPAEPKAVQQPTTEGGVVSEGTKEGQEEVLSETTGAPVETSTGIQPQLISGERAESQGAISGTYNIVTNESTEEWAKQQVDRFGGDLMKAFQESRRTEMTGFQRDFILKDILGRSVKQYTNNPTDLQALELTRTIPSILRQTGTESGQNLQARKAVNEKITPYAAVLSYTSGVQVRGLRNLSRGVQNVVKNFDGGAIKGALDAAEKEASTPDTKIEC